MPGSIEENQRRCCFTVMPYGKKVDPTTGDSIDFDQVYDEGIRPAVERVGLESIRADEGSAGDILHKVLFSRLLTADICVFDLTTSNPNVLYELGIRHTAKAAATIVVFSTSSRPPVDVSLLRGVPYQLTGGGLNTEGAGLFAEMFTKRLLEAAGSSAPDSPLFQLFSGFPGIDSAVIQRSPEVFLSYAHDDFERVKAIYEKLKLSGFKPWMDKFDIVPGEDWHRAIEIAIRRCDFFVPFLSRNSSNRRGIVQTEFRGALERAKEMLESDIYIIPVRLEECEMPEYFGSQQWVDVYEEDGWTKLTKGLTVGYQRRNA